MRFFLMHDTPSSFSSGSARVWDKGHAAGLTGAGCIRQRAAPTTRGLQTGTLTGTAMEHGEPEERSRHHLPSPTR